MFGRLLDGLVRYIYISGGSCPLTNFATCKIHFTSKSRVMAALLHRASAAGVIQTLRRDSVIHHTRNGIRELSQGATYIQLGGHHDGHRPTFYGYKNKIQNSQKVSCCFASENVKSVRSRSLYGVAVLPVVRSVVCRAYVTRLCALLGGLKFSAVFLRRILSSIDIHEKKISEVLAPRGTPPSGGIKRRGVAKYSDFGSIDGCISEKAQDRR